MRCRAYLLLILVLSYPTSYVFSQQVLNNGMLSAFKYRNMAPHYIGSWISNIAVPETQDSMYKDTYYIVGRNGGVWKTEDKGVTFKPVFDHYGTSTVGSIAIAHKRPNNIWVGTGNSSYRGNGIYKSTNGGTTFYNMGLIDSQYIARIVVDPNNSNKVYAAAMGHPFGVNKKRGVFRTTNGGKTWKKVLYINNHTGIIDLAINPHNPSVLYAVIYDKIDQKNIKSGVPSNGIYKTTDAGVHWKRLKNGLPSGEIGRIGIDIYSKNPNVLYAVIENNNHDKNGEKKGGEVYRTDDAGVTWERMNNDSVDVSPKAPSTFSSIMIDPNNDSHLFINNVSVEYSYDKGKTWHNVGMDPAPTPSILKSSHAPASNLFSDMFGDVRSMWVDPSDSKHLILGSDGGVFVTYNGGKTMRHLTQISLGEVYNVDVDDVKPFNIYVALQDHEVWKAPSNSYNGAIGIRQWNLVGKFDGQDVKVDHRNNRWLYVSSSYGSLRRVDQLRGERVNITPKSSDEEKYNFTWTAPIEISPFNSHTIYTGAQKLLRSEDQGDNWQKLSPNLTTDNSKRIIGKRHHIPVPEGAITTISVSSKTPGLIWAGTSAGKVFVTRNHGHEWIDVSQPLVKAGVPKGYWITSVVASSHKSGTAYITVSGFKHDDFRPFVFKTENYGKSWQNISTDLPDQPANAILEAKENPDLLFLANDAGIYVSINGGNHWTNMNNNIPPVPVNDIVIQNRESDLVVGTFGRGVYITDIDPLEQLTPKILTNDVYLFDIKSQPRLNYSQQRSWGIYLQKGNSHIYTPNEPNGLKIYYYLKNSLQQKPSLVIKNEKGETLKTITGPDQRGINKVIWDTKDASPGTYTVTLKASGSEISKKGVVEKRLLWTVGNKDKIQRR